MEKFLDRGQFIQKSRAWNFDDSSGPQRDAPYTREDSSSVVKPDKSSSRIGISTWGRVFFGSSRLEVVNLQGLQPHQMQHKYKYKVCFVIFKELADFLSLMCVCELIAVRLCPCVLSHGERPDNDSGHAD